MNTREYFAQKLTALLRQSSKTQADLAKYMNVAPPTVTDWKKARKMPRMDKIDALATFFNVSTDYLLGKTNTPTTEISPAKTKSTDLLDFLFHDEPDFLAKIRSIDVKGKITEPGMILKLNEQQKSRLKDIIRLTVKEAEMNTETHTAKTVVKKN